MTGLGAFGGAVAEAEPLFILSPPRSFSSIVSAMVGQHPQMYALPETNLFGVSNIREWQEQCARASHNMSHGLLRTISELHFGGQTESGVIRARGWLERRQHFSTGYVFEQLARQISPRHLVDKSPSLVYNPRALRRVLEQFPDARFLHLVRHPRGQGASVMRRLELAGRRRQVPQWITDLASFRVAPGSAPVAGELDPQGGWYVLNLNICEFLQLLPPTQWKRIQGETLLRDPDTGLCEIAGWLGLRTDAAAVASMKHPERSPYACFGPVGAESGNDPLFMRNPFLRPSRGETHSLDGPLRWRADGGEFQPAVKDLARQFGYT